MGSNIIELAKLGHERSVELKASCGSVDVRSLAQLISDLATQLEVQHVRSTELAVQLANAESKRRELAAENAGLKSGASYFSYGSEHHFEWHKSAAEAVEAAEDAIDDYRGDACDGWSEEVDSICWGVIMQSSTKVGERPRNEDDCCDPAIDTICDYVLLPNIETPATDAFLAEVRAQTIRDALDESSDYLDTDCVMDMLDISYEDAELRTSGAIELHDALVAVANQLRKGE